MKVFKKLVAAAIVAVACMSAAPSVSAAGPIKFGVKAGISVNDLKFNEELVSSNNRTGFTGGFTAQFVAPIIGIGCDLSAMYTHRSNRISGGEDVNGNPVGSMNVNRDYIELPLNLRWEMNVIGISNIICPFLTTGPDFSFLLTKQNVKDAWNQKKFDVAWNFGFGVQLVKKVQLAASYGIGLTKSASGEDSLYGSGLSSKNRFWTVTAAYMF